MAIGLQTLKSRNKGASNALSLILLMACCMLIGRFVYTVHKIDAVRHWSLLPDAVIFLLGPVSYVYLNRLLFKNNQHFQLPLVHYLPVAIHIIIFLFFLLGFSAKEYTQLIRAGELSTLFRFIGGSAIVLNLYYWLKNLRLISYYTKREKEVLSFPQSPILYLNLFVGVIFSCILVWFTGYVTSFFFKRLSNLIGYDLIWIVIPILTYVIGFFHLIQPELLQVNQTHPSSHKDRLDQDEITRIQKILAKALEERIYDNPDLTLSDLANYIGISNHKLSWLLNNIYHSNFYQFVNKHRVEQFMRRVNNGDHLKQTLLSLSYEVGFKSKSTFNKVFKEVNQTTPSEYIKQQDP